MTVLQELVTLYDTQAEKKGWPQPGFSTEKVGACVVLDEDGSVMHIRSLMTPDARGKMQARAISVPKAVKRTANVKPNMFWDKTAYVLGVTETPDGPGQGKRTLEEHKKFKTQHLDLLDGAGEPAIVALRAFCETWEPERFVDFADAIVLLDKNVVFQLGNGPYIHELPAAQSLLDNTDEGDTVCLVSGRPRSVAELHPSIKGVMGAQSSGASLVSFNKDAYISHGKIQGKNAPVSQAAVNAYGTALNALLTKGSGNNLKIGGDTVAFWADQPEAEDWFGAFMSGTDVATAERDLMARLQAVAEGRAWEDESVNPDAKLFVLGLAPNAARLAVRYWHHGTIKGFAASVSRFWSDMAIAPSPFVKGSVELAPKPWALLGDMAPNRKANNIPAGLGGDLMRAILTGGRYPATLLSGVVGRLRVEGRPDKKAGNVDGRRAALIAAVLRRNHGQEVPMALDEDARDAAYLLGRLFGAYAYAEQSYNERGTSLRQKYMGAASASPARIFPMLMRGYEHNRSSLRKAGGIKAGAGVKADRAVAAIIGELNGDMPATLRLEAQGRFFIGFYHQNSAFYTKKENATDALIGTDDEGEDT